MIDVLSSAEVRRKAWKQFLRIVETLTEIIRQNTVLADPVNF